MSRKGKKGSSAEPQQAEAQVQAAQAQLIESLREQVAAAQESARRAETKLGDLQERHLTLQQEHNKVQRTIKQAYFLPMKDLAKLANMQSGASDDTDAKSGKAHAWPAYESMSNWVSEAQWRWMLAYATFMFSTDQASPTRRLVVHPEDSFGTDAAEYLLVQFCLWAPDRIAGCALSQCPGCGLVLHSKRWAEQE